MPSEKTESPILLGDGIEGEIDERGWVEANIAEPEARRMMIETTLGGDPLVTFAEGRKITMCPADEPDRWVKCLPEVEGAREFWEFELADVEVSSNGFR